MEQFLFFLKGPLSQWHPSTFVVDGITYCRAEQFMMAEKARLFGDTETLNKILVSTHPRDQKALGRLVKGFVKDKWDAVARDVVYRGNHAKFTQNPELLNYLLSTAPATLVETNPHDTIWAIGLSEDDPRAKNRSTWRGTNWLGEVLTQLRNDLIQDTSEKINNL